MANFVLTIQPDAPRTEISPNRKLFTNKPTRAQTLQLISLLTYHCDSTNNNVAYIGTASATSSLAYVPIMAASRLFPWLQFHVYNDPKPDIVAASITAHSLAEISDLKSLQPCIVINEIVLPAALDNALRELSAVLIYRYNLDLFLQNGESRTARWFTAAVQALAPLPSQALRMPTSTESIVYIVLGKQATEYDALQLRQQLSFINQGIIFNDEATILSLYLKKMALSAELLPKIQKLLNTILGEVAVSRDFDQIAPDFNKFFYKTAELIIEPPNMRREDRYTAIQNIVAISLNVQEFVALVGVYPNASVLAVEPNVTQYQQIVTAKLPPGRRAKIEIKHAPIESTIASLADKSQDIIVYRVRAVDNVANILATTVCPWIAKTKTITLVVNPDFDSKGLMQRFITTGCFVARPWEVPSRRPNLLLIAITAKIVRREEEKSQERKETKVPAKTSWRSGLSSTTRSAPGTYTVRRG